MFAYLHPSALFHLVSLLWDGRRLGAVLRPMPLDTKQQRGVRVGGRALRLAPTLSALFAALFAALWLGACSRSDWDPTLKIGDPQGHVIGRPDPSGAQTMPLIQQGGIALGGMGHSPQRTRSRPVPGSSSASSLDQRWIPHPGM